MSTAAAIPTPSDSEGCICESGMICLCSGGSGETFSEKLSSSVRSGFLLKSAGPFDSWRVVYKSRRA